MKTLFIILVIISATLIVLGGAGYWVYKNEDEIIKWIFDNVIWLAVGLALPVVGAMFSRGGYHYD